MLSEDDGSSDHATTISEIGPPTPVTESLCSTSNSRRVTFIGSWDAVYTAIQAYPGSAQATAVITCEDHSVQVDTASGEYRRSGRLSTVLKLSERRESLDSVDSSLKLTLLLPQEHGSASGWCHVNSGANYSVLPDECRRQEEFAGTEEIDPNTCGNCGSDKHRAAVCAKVGKSGWMETCPKCDSRQHTYEHCPHRRQYEDFQYLIVNRKHKGPVKCSLHLGRVVLLELRRHCSSYRDTSIVGLPHSSKFSRQIATIPKLSQNCMVWTPGEVLEPSRQWQTLGCAVSLLGDQHWTIDEETPVDHDDECEVCSGKHSKYECLCLCGFCGDWNHRTVFCQNEHKACVCTRYPGHNSDKCKQPCWYCAKILRLDETYHYARDCPIICCMCFESDHTTGCCHMGPMERKCSLCPNEEYHYPLAHIVCPGDGCEMLVDRMDCQKHCRNCG